MKLAIIIILFGVLCTSVLFEGTKYSKKAFLVWGILLILYACIADKSELPDYTQYVNLFLTEGSIIIEPTFLFIKFMVKSVSEDNLFLFFGIYLLLGCSLKYLAFKQLTYLPILTLALYISSYFIYHEMIQIRVGVASALLLLSIRPLYERNLKKFLLCVVIAILFHTSALAMLPLWFVNPFKKQRRLYFLLILISMILYVLRVDIVRMLEYIPIPYIQEKIIGYSDITIEAMDRGVLTVEEYNPFCTWYMFKLCVLVFLWMTINRISKFNPYAILMLKIFTIGMACYWLFASVPTFATRCSELLSVVQVVLIPMTVYLQRRNRLIAYIPTVFICLVWLFWNVSSFDIL